MSAEYDWIAGFWRATLGVSLLLIACVIVACAMTVIWEWPHHWNQLKERCRRVPKDLTRLDALRGLIAHEEKDQRKSDTRMVSTR